MLLKTKSEGKERVAGRKVGTWAKINCQPDECEAIEREKGGERKTACRARKRRKNPFVEIRKRIEKELQEMKLAWDNSTRRDGEKTAIWQLRREKVQMEHIAFSDNSNRPVKSTPPPKKNNRTDTRYQRCQPRSFT